MFIEFLEWGGGSSQTSVIKFIKFIKIRWFSYSNEQKINQEPIPANTFFVEYAGDVINFGELCARVHKYENQKKHNFCFQIYDDTDWRSPCIDSLVSIISSSYSFKMFVRIVKTNNCLISISEMSRDYSITAVVRTSSVGLITIRITMAEVSHSSLWGILALENNWRMIMDPTTQKDWNVSVVRRTAGNILENSPIEKGRRNDGDLDELQFLLIWESIYWSM